MDPTTFNPQSPLPPTSRTSNDPLAEPVGRALRQTGSRRRSNDRPKHGVLPLTASIDHIGLLDEDELQLDRAALDIAGLDHPDHAAVDALAFLERICARVRAKTGELDTAMERAVWLAGVIAGEFGFDGDRETYDDPANADLILVLERRRGLPVSLALIYVAIARRVGWQAFVLDTPGHALMAIDGASPVVLDPFNGGAQVPARTLATPPAGREVRLEQLAPMTNRAVLVRLLMNQSTRAAQARQFERALVVMRRVTTAAPGYTPGWWERARLELAVDEPQAARLSLNSMLETTKDHRLRGQVLDALNSLPSGDGA